METILDEEQRGENQPHEDTANRRIRRNLILEVADQMVILHEDTYNRRIRRNLILEAARSNGNFT